MSAELVEVGYTVAGIRAAAEPILRRLAATAREREAGRDHAFADVRALAEARITLLGIATEDGGAGGTVRDVTDLIIAVARADSNIAQALRSSFLIANQVASRPDLPNRAVVLRRLRDGDLLAGTANERSGGPAAPSTPPSAATAPGTSSTARSTTRPAACTRRGSPAWPRTRTAPW
ncbi:acyl-CoA dehydrogenase family protein [Dactylosporangium cerinum]